MVSFHVQISSTCMHGDFTICKSTCMHVDDICAWNNVASAITSPISASELPRLPSLCPFCSTSTIVVLAIPNIVDTVSQPDKAWIPKSCDTKFSLFLAVALMSIKVWWESVPSKQ